MAEANPASRPPKPRSAQTACAWEFMPSTSRVVCRKVEYSGTLHEAPGSTLPVVFDSPSMRDVAGEGLTMLLAPPPLAPLAYLASPAAPESSESPAGAACLDGLFFAGERFYPPFAASGFAAEVLRLANDEVQFEAARQANAAAGRRLGFGVVAARYRDLAVNLLFSSSPAVLTTLRSS